MAPSSIWSKQEDAIFTENYVGDNTAEDVRAALQRLWDQDASYKVKTLKQVQNRIKNLKLSKVERGPNMEHWQVVLLTNRVITQKANDEANGIIRTWLAYQPTQMSERSWKYYVTMINNGTWEAWSQPRQLSMTTGAVAARRWRENNAGAPPALPPLPMVGDDEIAAARAAAVEAVAASGMEDVSF